MIKEHQVRVKQTMEGLYLNANDIEEVIYQLCRAYPSHTLNRLINILDITRFEYEEGLNDN